MTASPQIIAYIKEQTARGFSTDAIRQVMIQSGYTAMQVEEAFQGAGIEVPEQPPVREPAPEPVQPVQSIAAETPRATIEPVVSTPAPAENAEIFPPAQKVEVEQPAATEPPQQAAVSTPVTQPQGSFMPVRDIRPTASSAPSPQIITQSIPSPSPTFPTAMPSQLARRIMPAATSQGPGTFRAAPGAGPVARTPQRAVIQKQKKSHLLSVLIALIFVLFAGGVFAHWYLIAKQPPIGEYVRTYIPIPKNLPINLNFLNFLKKETLGNREINTADEELPPPGNNNIQPTSNTPPNEQPQNLGENTPAPSDEPSSETNTQ